MVPYGINPSAHIPRNVVHIHWSSWILVDSCEISANKRSILMIRIASVGRSSGGVEENGKVHKSAFNTEPAKWKHCHRDVCCSPRTKTQQHNCLVHAQTGQRIHYSSTNCSPFSLPLWDRFSLPNGSVPTTGSRSISAHTRDTLHTSHTHIILPSGSFRLPVSRAGLACLLPQVCPEIEFVF